VLSKNVQDPLSGTFETEFETPVQPKYQVGGFPSSDPKVNNNTATTTTTTGGARQFFQKKGSKLLHDAALSEGLSMECLEFVSTKGLRAGAISIHNGNTWHGSGKNTSSKPRRGLGLHYVPAQVKFTEEACFISLWRRYLIHDAEDETHKNASDVILNKDDFPVIF